MKVSFTGLECEFFWIELIRKVHLSTFPQDLAMRKAQLAKPCVMK